MKGLQLLLVFTGMLILFPVLFTLAYLLWNVNYVASLLILFVGLSIDLLGGFELLDFILNRM